jgi:hypothetical protein
VGIEWTNNYSDYQVFYMPSQSANSICGVAVASEYLRNYLDGDGAEVKYVVVGSLKLRQDNIHFRLGLRSSGLRAQLTNAVLLDGGMARGATRGILPFNA